MPQSIWKIRTRRNVYLTVTVVLSLSMGTHCGSQKDALGSDLARHETSLTKLQICSCNASAPRQNENTKIRRKIKGPREDHANTTKVNRSPLTAYSFKEMCILPPHCTVTLIWTQNLQPMQQVPIHFHPKFSMSIDHATHCWFYLALKKTLGYSVLLSSAALHYAGHIYEQIPNRYRHILHGPTSTPTVAMHRWRSVTLRRTGSDR